MIKDILRKLKGQTESATAAGATAAAPEAPQTATPAPEHPAMPPVKQPRRVIDAPVKFMDSQVLDAGQGGVRILAQVTPKGDECRLTAEREVLPNLSWFFGSPPSGEDSPLVTALFAADADVESVLLDGPRVVITRKAKYNRDWKPLAKSVGSVLRAQLEAATPALAPSLLAKRLSDEEIRSRIQTVIDNEVNPGVAGHGGQVAIVKIENNAITVNMGGGCQGCSSAAVTLKGGIERSFRQAVPTLGALHDATDHSAGTNPFYS